MSPKTKNRGVKARLVYVNLGDGDDDVKLGLLEEEKDRADVIACSEHADRVDVTSRFIERNPEWARWYGDGRLGAAKECLLYRKALGEVTLRKTYTLVGKRKLAPGAGPENADPKCANRVRIRLAKRYRARTLNLTVAHQYATVGNRKEAAWLFINSLIDVVRGLVGVTVFFGDLNATPGHALVRALRAVFSSSSAPKSGPTFGQRLIDYIMIRGAKLLRAEADKVRSDHKKVVAEILL